MARTAKSCYYNPPDQIPSIGRLLIQRGFDDLTAQLAPTEILIGLYRNQLQALVATYLDSRERMEEMEAAWNPAEGYYAVDRVQAQQGLS